MKHLTLVTLSAVSLSFVGSPPLHTTAMADNSKSKAPADAKAANPPQKPRKNTAVIPELRKKRGWLKEHEALNAEVKKGDIDLIFIGDSITSEWSIEGKEVWARYYTPRKALNLGLSGDRTQHILWRLDHGNVEGIKPKLAVLLIGTNNYQDNTVEEIAAGIEAVVRKLQEKLPDTKVLLMGLLPRGEKPSEIRDKLAAVNQIIAKLDDGVRVVYIDIGDRFLNPDGTLKHEAMPDTVHPVAKGFEIWAEAIEPQVVRLMGEKPAK